MYFENFNSTQVLIWLAVFFILFFVYIDIRVTQLREEIMNLYANCEASMIQKVSQNRVEQFVPRTREFTENAPVDAEKFPVPKVETHHYFKPSNKSTMSWNNISSSGNIESYSELEMSGYAPFKLL